MRATPTSSRRRCRCRRRPRTTTARSRRRRSSAATGWRRSRGGDRQSTRPGSPRWRWRRLDGAPDAFPLARRPDSRPAVHGDVRISDAGAAVSVRGQDDGSAHGWHARFLSGVWPGVRDREMRVPSAEGPDSGRDRARHVGPRAARQWRRLRRSVTDAVSADLSVRLRDTMGHHAGENVRVVVGADVPGRRWGLHAGGDPGRHRRAPLGRGGGPAPRGGGGFRREEIQAAIGAPRSAASASQSDAVAVIPLRGVIAHRMDALDEASGGTSVVRFAQMFRAALADAAVGSILLDVDSPGGTVPGVQEMATEMLQAGGKGTKRIVAIANSLMASAAYWLASP